MRSMTWDAEQTLVKLPADLADARLVAEGLGLTCRQIDLTGDYRALPPSIFGPEAGGIPVCWLATLAYPRAFSPRPLRPGSGRARPMKESLGCPMRISTATSSAAKLIPRLP